MADIKWIKLTTNIHDDEKMRLMDAMPERDTVHYLWIRLLIQAGKTNANGLIYLNENMAYTDEMLAIIFSRPIESIKLALKTLKDFGMIEIDEDNFIKISNWDKHQNIEGMDRVRAQNRKRVENHREKKKQLEAATEENEEMSIKNEAYECSISQNSCNVTEYKSNVNVMEQNKRENKKKNKNEIKNEREIKKDTTNHIKNAIDINNEIEGENSDTCHDKKASNLENSQAVKDSVSLSKVPIIEDNKGFEDNKKFNNNKDFQDMNVLCCELQKYCETITGMPDLLNLGALKLAIGVHGHKYVKMAIDIGLKANKFNMTYIDGILKNWRREGYPTEKEERKHGNGSYGKNGNTDKNTFAGFKPKEPRSLTEAERKRAEANLI